MECRDAVEVVEAIAAGDMHVEAPAREHFETCTRCAAALASAQRLEEMLAARGAPAAPEGFTSTVLQRIRRERWRAEQQVDWLFNVAIATAVLLVVGGAFAIFNVDGLLSLTASGWELVKEGSRGAARDAAPTVGTYLAAAALLLSALGTWWWAERRLQF
jgi:anti-sigma factor RsiW